MKDERQEFESAFDKEIKEVLVLTQNNPSAGKAGNAHLWEASLTLLSYIDILTDTLIQKETRLVWQLIDEECRTKEKIYNLEKERIYHLKVRESMDRYSLMLVEVVEQNCENRRLKDILEDYQKPVMIHPEGCGEFLLDKSLGLFNADGQWNGEPCTIHLDVDEDNAKTALDASATLKKLLSNSKQWDGLARGLAAAELTGTANDWQTEKDKDAVEITEEEFAQRLSISDLSVLTGGDFEIFYEDDDMFWGHAIIVSGNVNTGVEDADMAG